ncbi:hypothetical protein IJ732_00570, partial [bacterium]|nr:hypothetical protein [bacterium]
LVSHSLKMNNILSNALKNTEATEQTKFYKLSETDFKSKFESHLKTTGCDADAGDTNFTPNVCLADGSQFAYGTFDESCTDNICDTLTIDTNGKKGPNTAGKDRFTMNLTPNGLKALGESNSCETGLDCGAYILAQHKLWEDCKSGYYRNGDGLCNQITVSNCTNADKNGNCTSCTSGKIVSGVNSCVPGKTLPDGTEYATVFDKFYSDAISSCTNLGMHLPTKSEVETLKEKGLLDENSYDIIWTATEVEEGSNNVWGYQVSSGGFYPHYTKTGGLNGLPLSTFCVK